jgi:hypothetical protein
VGIFNVKASAPQSNDLAPSGNHPAALVAMIDLGTHEEDFQGTKKKNHKVYLAWELTAEEKHMVVGRDYTLSFSPKSALRGMVEKWRGKSFGDGEQFDLSKVLGKSCLIAIVHKQSTGGDRTYARIDGITPVPKGMTVPPPTKELVCWDMSSGTEPPAHPWIPYLYGEPIGDVIRRSYEWNDRQAGGGTAGQEEEMAAASASPSGGDADEAPF